MSGGEHRLDATTFRTLDGRVLDLAGLRPPEAAFLAECRAAFRSGMAWAAFAQVLDGPTNPLLHSSGGVVTADVYVHPLFVAARDMEDRLGIAQGKLRSRPGAAPALGSDPFADEWLSVTEAAVRKGVSVTGLHKAIARGDVVARPAKEGGTWLVVSANSLEGWQPQRAKAHRRTAAPR